MLPSRLNTDQPVESRRPRMRFESRCAEEGDSNSSEFAGRVQQEAEEESREIVGLVIDSSSDEEQFDQYHYFKSFVENTMSYPSPKYNDEADAEAHIQAFLTTWQANHISQRLSEDDVDISKIAELGLSLEGQSVNWYSQHGVGEFE